MVIADEFVYVHMPKTGGTFVEEVLRRVLGRPPGWNSDVGADQHQPVSAIPHGHRHKPVLFTVRNPYDHYVSFYCFGWWRDHAGDTFDARRIRARYPHFPELDFGEYLEAALDWDLLTEPYRCVREPFEAAGLGPLTLDYVRYLSTDPDRAVANLSDLLARQTMCAGDVALHVVPMEQLNRDLHAFLIELGYDAADVDFVPTLEPIFPPQSTPRRDTSVRWEDWYTDDLLAMVAERERLVFSTWPMYDPQPCWTKQDISVAC